MRVVPFCDKTKINKFNSNGRSWSWIKDGECVRPQYVHETMKHGGGSVMIWGCMMAFGPGACTKLKVGYIGMCTSLFYSFRYYGMDPNRLVF